MATAQKHNETPEGASLPDQVLVKLAAQHFAGMVVDLRGIAHMQDVAQEYASMFEGAVTTDAFVDLVCNQRMEGAPYGLLHVDEECYLVHPFLISKCEDETDIVDNGCITVSEDSLPTVLSSLLEAQKDFDPRELERIMLAEGSLFAWKMKQPAARELSVYFNNHVPVGQGDDFTEKIMRNILQMTTGGYKPTDLIDYLASEAFSVEEKEAVDLLTNLLSAMPRWDTNGWSADDLMYKEYGYTVSTAPSSGKQVGRNDPCPCGSGKKFKKCCGRYL